MSNRPVGARRRWARGARATLGADAPGIRSALSRPDCGERPGGVDIEEEPVDFHYTPEQDAFRQELRRWLAANLTPDLCVDDPTDERVAPDRPTFERRVQWQRTMHKAGWVGISWPVEYGGRGATLMEQ